MTASARRLDTALLLRAYAAGLFPMADTREADDVFWVEPRRRGILPLDGFHLPRSLLKVLRQDRFRHSRDLAFGAVIRSCAAHGPGRQQSWINASILEAYERLHAEGHAHSIETWDAEGRLVGGLYGVRMGAAFFGESMFSRATDASKAALCHLVARLRAGGFRLLDTQFLTGHLARFGGLEVRRNHYLGLLNLALVSTGDWQALDRSLSIAYPAAPTLALPAVPGPAPVDLVLSGGADFGPSGKSIAQALSQTS
jgi:leucyl/phenylalanyl-tRNA--protein transferase